MQRISFLVLLLLNTQVNAYVYRIDPNNKYHTAPPILNIQDQHAASKAGEIIGRPVGYIIGGVVGVVAGVLEGIAGGLGKGIDDTI